MEGVPAHTVVDLLSPHKKERLSDALLRLIEKKKQGYIEGDKIPVYEKDIAFIHFNLYKAEKIESGNSRKIEPITPDEIRNFILSRNDCELAKDIVRQGSHTVKILRPARGHTIKPKIATELPRTLSGKDLAAGEKDN